MQENQIEDELVYHIDVFDSEIGANVKLCLCKTNIYIVKKEGESFKMVRKYPLKQIAGLIAIDLEEYADFNSQNENSIKTKNQCITFLLADGKSFILVNKFSTSILNDEILQLKNEE